VTSEWSRIYLMPHGPVALDREGAVPPVVALYESAHAPARLLR